MLITDYSHSALNCSVKNNYLTVQDNGCMAMLWNRTISDASPLHMTWVGSM